MFSTALLRKHVKKSVKNIVVLVIAVQVVLALLHLGQYKIFVSEIINTLSLVGKEFTDTCAV